MYCHWGDLDSFGVVTKRQTHKLIKIIFHLSQ
jgi:hypothetical protein